MLALSAALARHVAVDGNAKCKRSFVEPGGQRLRKTTKPLAAGLAAGGVAALALALAAPAMHASPGGPGTLDDWTATVCVPGTFKGGSGGGPVQPHATWRGGCVAREDATPIFIGKYGSRSDEVASAPMPGVERARK
jgi:hypothetical protein